MIVVSGVGKFREGFIVRHSAHLGYGKGHLGGAGNFRAPIPELSRQSPQSRIQLKFPIILPKFMVRHRVTGYVAGAIRSRVRRNVGLCGRIYLLWPRLSFYYALVTQAIMLLNPKPLFSPALKTTTYMASSRQEARTFPP